MVSLSFLLAFLKKSNVLGKMTDYSSIFAFFALGCYPLRWWWCSCVCLLLVEASVLYSMEQPNQANGAGDLFVALLSPVRYGCLFLAACHLRGQLPMDMNLNFVGFATTKAYVIADTIQRSRTILIGQEMSSDLRLAGSR